MAIKQRDWRGVEQVFLQCRVKGQGGDALRPAIEKPIEVGRCAWNLLILLGLIVNVIGHIIVSPIFILKRKKKKQCSYIGTNMNVSP